MLRTGTAALVGRPAYVLEEVSGEAAGSGSAARNGPRGPMTSSQVIPAGETVDVMQIKGATALVHPRELGNVR